MGIEDEVREQKDASEGEKAQIEVGSSDTTASGTQDGAESARVEVPASPESDKSATKSPTLSDVADSPREKGRRPSKGPSALEQVMSKTRMMHLPPKQKNEEAKHLEDFERMMKAHKAFEKKKEAELAEKRRKKDEERREASAVWEKDILPSWTRARKDERLRQVWWKGAPPAFRGRVWALAIGNAQMLPRNLLDLASKSISEHKKDGTFPKGVSEEIREDVKNTLPSLKLFQEGTGPMNEDLVNLLEAYVVKRGITLYHKGTSSLAALLLINQPPSSAFISLLNLIWSRPWLKAIHSVKPAMSRYTEMKGFERVFDTLLADQMPKVYANMLARGLSISETILRAWVAHMFGKWLDCDTVMRLWDVILLDESDSLIYRICLALVQTLESRLYVPDKEEMRSVLEGTNQAALRIWRRERAPLLVVPLDNIYEQYGINEEVIFRALEAQESWWKQSTLERLLDRELAG
ncbi:RabGAP/TBC [Violaceomyces palustris]|uniref:RabGAP/TBC n=1 Tax=Violaceomyces palustris TaxID=1673888 RepID=A0ACD0P0Y9_9BASI|nr:RabGAP/TBC [Violaceomyces palustris]